ncbi:MAG: hypothetical protein ACLQB1_11615 [Streptosporangiaceae bacterium]
MTGTNLIVLAPWIAFAVGLAAICLLLLRSRRASGSQRSPRPMSGPAGAVSRPDRTPADRTPAEPAPADRGTASGLHPQEAICSQKNAKA